MAKKYIVTLSGEEREGLLRLIACGTERACKLTHARILLKADEGWLDQAISEALNVSVTTIERNNFQIRGYRTLEPLSQPL